MSAEQREYFSSAADWRDAVEWAKVKARADGRRIMTTCGVKGKPGAYVVTLALKVPDAVVETP